MDNNIMNRILSEPPTFRMPTSQVNPAQWTYERLVNYINDFEEKLDDEYEIGARLVSFGSEVTFHIQDIGYHGPDIISFTGIDDKSQTVQLIQNISQLSVLLIAVIKTEEEARRIGFALKEKMKN